MSATVLLTGATGIVGRAVHRELSRSGTRVLIPPHRRGERLDLSQFDLDTEGIRPAAVIHLASDVPHELARDTEARADVTRTIDENVFRAIERWDVPSIYVSSCSFLDRTAETPCDETSALLTEIQSPYLRAKLDGERLFCRRTDTTIFRLSAPMGDGLRMGTVVPAFIKAARNDGRLTVWGDGSREQDFIDTRDIASLVSACVHSPRFGMFMMANGKPTTMLELAVTIIEVIGGGTLDRDHRIDPNSGIRARYDISKTCSSFAWRPRYSLRESIATIGELVS